MFHEKSDYFTRLLFVLDFLVSTLSFLIVLQLHDTLMPGHESDHGAHLRYLPLILGLFMVLRLWANQKPSLNLVSPSQQIWMLLREQTLLLITLMSLVFVLKLTFVSRFVTVGYFLVNSAVLISARAFIIWWYFDRRHEKLQNFVRILVVGSGRRARMMAAHLQHELEWGVSIVGFLDPEGRCAGRRKDDRILGDVSEISRVLEQNVVDEVIVAVPRAV